MLAQPFGVFQPDSCFLASALLSLLLSSERSWLTLQSCRSRDRRDSGRAMRIRVGHLVHNLGPVSEQRQVAALPLMDGNFGRRRWSKQASVLSERADYSIGVSEVLEKPFYFSATYSSLRIRQDCVYLGWMTYCPKLQTDVDLLDSFASEISVTYAAESTGL
jgi:hypothetical protein